MATKADLLRHSIEHIDPTEFDARPIIDAYRKMAFQARNTARAADILSMMQKDTDCAVIMTLAGSLISAGLKKTILTLLENNMIDAIVSTGANIVDQDFFEGLGFKHWIAPGSPEAPEASDTELRDLAIDRIYDTYIDEDQLRLCDDTTQKIFDSLEPGAYSSRQLLEALGAYLDEHHPKAESILLSAYRKRVPIYVPALSDCSAGFGIVMHQAARPDPKTQVSIDSGRDFLELTRVKLLNPTTGLLMIGGGVPKNFAQDIVVAAELLADEDTVHSGEVSMHKYAVQVTVADSRDGALSGSTLREACSWGKVDVVHEQMVFGEATTILPLLVSDAYHREGWKARPARALAKQLDDACAPAKV